MITLKCDTGTYLKLTEMKPFQGDLKRRTNADIDELRRSIVEEGLLMPFAIWDDGNGAFNILDGHGRYEALVKQALTDPSVLTQPLPVLKIQAETEEDARKALLQIVSVYGKVTKKGLITFIEKVPTYHAPVIRSMAHKVTKYNQKTPAEDYVIVRLRCKRDTAASILPLLKDVDGVEIY